MEPVVNYRRSRRRHLFSVTYQQVRIADRVIYTTSTRDATPRWKAEIDDDRREISRNKKSARVINERRARASSRKDLITAAARGCRSLGTGFPLVLFAPQLLSLVRRFLSRFHLPESSLQILHFCGIPISFLQRATRRKLPCAFARFVPFLRPSQSEILTHTE